MFFFFVFVDLLIIKLKLMILVKCLNHIFLYIVYYIYMSVRDNFITYIIPVYSCVPEFIIYIYSYIHTYVIFVCFIRLDYLYQIFIHT
ncbi:hypothetical protein C2G38_885373 [Gigaspora rosea]|uniref:Uncharacterized protein n=1 Tax=Gigaspora rosea TaxID=44941 RepID=A0A397VL78_9GLOM|nr:hypothetical protein C2G38_885373 [Gigaspora rosea]